MRRGARTPEELETLFEDAFVIRDSNALVQLFEDGAVLVAAGPGIPLYRHVLERVPAASGTSVLDVGCGAGRFCRMAADRGMRPCADRRPNLTPPPD